MPSPFRRLSPLPRPNLGGSVTRSRRDWGVDATLFLGAAVLGLLTMGDLAEDPARPPWYLALDQVVGALACCLVWLRRRWPTQLALLLIPASVLFYFAGWPQLVLLFTVAVHRPPRVLAPVALLTVLAAPLQRPEPGTSVQENTFIGLVLVLTAVGWGMFVYARRELLAALRERARRAEADAELRAAQAQRSAREAIAREMHDVLAHRLSLLSLHAGALEFRTDAPAQETAEAAGVIRQSAHQALEELREVIGVLRAPDDGTGPGGLGESSGVDAGLGQDRPQPSLDDVPRLLQEARGVGMRVRWTQALGPEPVAEQGVGTEPSPAAGVQPEDAPTRAVGQPVDAASQASAQPPAAVGRTVYRVVQEGLTNARKHAPHARVEVTLRGAPGEGVRIRVSNPLPKRHTESEVPGAGQGLVGLTERVALGGGTLHSGVVEDAGRRSFVLDAWLPWSP